MIGLALLTVGVVQSTIAVPNKRAVRLELLQRVASARFYADDRYRCEGLSSTSAHRQARRALGRAFDERLDRVIDHLARLYGKEAVGEATELVAIGYKITPQRCARVQGIIGEARSGLLNLEASLGED